MSIGTSTYRSKSSRSNTGERATAMLTSRSPAGMPELAGTTPSSRSWKPLSTPAGLVGGGMDASQASTVAESVQKALGNCMNQGTHMRVGSSNWNGVYKACRLLQPTCWDDDLHRFLPNPRDAQRGQVHHLRGALDRLLKADPHGGADDGPRPHAPAAKAAPAAGEHLLEDGALHGSSGRAAGCQSLALPGRRQTHRVREQEATGRNTPDRAAGLQTVRAACRRAACRQPCLMRERAWKPPRPAPPKNSLNRSSGSTCMAKSGGEASRVKRSTAGVAHCSRCTAVVLAGRPFQRAQSQRRRSKAAANGAGEGPPCRSCRWTAQRARRRARLRPHLEAGSREWPARPAAGSAASGLHVLVGRVSHAVVRLHA